MLFVFGARSFQTSLGVGLRDCPQCGVRGPHDVVHAGTKVSVFFVPVFTSSGQRMAVCSQCGFATELSRAEADHLVASGSYAPPTSPPPTPAPLPGPQDAPLQTPQDRLPETPQDRR